MKKQNLLFAMAMVTAANASAEITRNHLALAIAIPSIIAMKFFNDSNNLQDMLASLESESDKLKKEISKQKSDLLAVKSNLEKMISEKESKIAAMEVEKIELQNSSSNHIAQINSLNLKISEAEKITAEFQVALENSNNLITQKDAAISEIRRSLVPVESPACENCECENSAPCEA